MDEKTPSSLQYMLEKSLSTFQDGSGTECDFRPAPLAKEPDTDAEEQALCARVLKVLATAPGAILEAALAVDAAGKREPALFLYTLSLAVQPDARAYNNLAVLCAEADDEETALEWLERGLEHFPLDATLRDNYEALQE